MEPTVSICLPNLNARPFLVDRFESIFEQTFQSWELIVCDSYSEDGSWEYIQKLAAQEPRMRISQTPRHGIYAGFNDCIKLARGKYVYIAPSDDTMMPDCLEKMVAALEDNPDCGICQCALVVIDEKGIPHASERQWNFYPFGNYDQNLVTKKNKRFAPHDGIVHPALFTVYTSLTQILIRKTVFDRIGLFDGRWGSVSDYEWEMRAGLTENCIFIPEKLATWRIHNAQASGQVDTPALRLKMMEMAKVAFARAMPITGSSLSKIELKNYLYFLDRDFVEMAAEKAGGRIARLLFLGAQLFQRPKPVWDYVWSRRGPGGRIPWKNSSRHALLKYHLQMDNVPMPIFL